MPPRARSTIGLYLFQADPAKAASALAQGVDGIIFDIEQQGKRLRQTAFDTSITSNSIDQLFEFVECSGIAPICRIDPWSRGSARQIEIAAEAGVEAIILPMARTLKEIDAFIDTVAGRVKIGLMLETPELLELLPEISDRRPDLAYVGLQDLMIIRGGQSLFRPLHDGTVERIRDALPEVSLGVAGATDPRFGKPVPFRLLAAEMSRLGVDFTFLRRSFLADVPSDQIGAAVMAIRMLWVELSQRDAEAVLADRRKFSEVADALCRSGEFNSTA